MFDGVTAFTLYDTYGFPLDLTQDALKPRGIGVDIAAFTDAMERQREQARASWVGSGEAADEAVWFSLREKAWSPLTFSATKRKMPPVSCWRCCATAKKSWRLIAVKAAPSFSIKRHSMPNPAARSAIPAC